MSKDRRDRQPADLTMDRLPPHSTEAEMGVLGCILLDPKGVIPQCQERIKDPEEVFFGNNNREVYDALSSLWEQDKMGFVKISESRNEWLFLVTEELRDRKKLDDVGGKEFLEELMDFSPHPENINAYLEVLLSQGVLRGVIKGCMKTVSWIYENRNRAYDEILDHVESEILQLCQDRIATDASTDVTSAVHKVIENMEAAVDGRGVAIRTGFPDLDKKLGGGLREAQYYVIAARPSLGKTSLAMGIAENLAIGNKIPVGVFSLEMRKEDLVLRAISSRARINSMNMIEGRLVESDYPKITRAAGQIASSPLHVDDTPGLSITQLRGKARRMVVEKGCKVIIIDYIQLLHCLGRRYENNRQQEIADISAGLKALGKELNVPVVILAQLNRDVEKEKRKPRMSDLRESGAIEQDADMIGFLYRPGDIAKDGDRYEREDEREKVNLLIAKQRNGPTGEVPFWFTPQFTRYESVSKVGDEDVPENQEAFETL